MPSYGFQGSYLMREFARHVIELSAEQDGQVVAAGKIDKSTWSLRANPDLPLRVRYRVYAWDRSVRGCQFDSSRGFINPAACLLQDVSSPDGIVRAGRSRASVCRWRAMALRHHDGTSRGRARLRSLSRGQLRRAD